MPQDLNALAKELADLPTHEILQRTIDAGIFYLGAAQITAVPGPFVREAQWALKAHVDALSNALEVDLDPERTFPERLAAHQAAQERGGGGGDSS